MCLRGICGERRPWSDCASAQSDLGPSLSAYRIIGYCGIYHCIANVPKWLQLRWLIRIFAALICPKGTFLHGEAQADYLYEITIEFDPAKYSLGGYAKSGWILYSVECKEPNLSARMRMLTFAFTGYIYATPPETLSFGQIEAVKIPISWKRRTTWSAPLLLVCVEVLGPTLRKHAIKIYWKFYNQKRKIFR